MSYVAGGWGATAAFIALYTWRTLRRGRILSRNLESREQAPAGAAMGDPTWR